MSDHPTAYCDVCQDERLHVESEAGYGCMKCQELVTPYSATESLRVHLIRRTVPLGRVAWTGTGILVLVFRGAGDVPGSWLGYPVQAKKIGGSCHWPEKV